MTVTAQTDNKAVNSTLGVVPHSPAIASTPISQMAVSMLRKRLRGAVLTAEDEGYDAARQVWNAMIDRKPGVIARCADASDVQAAVARYECPPLSPRRRPQYSWQRGP